MDHASGGYRGFGIRARRAGGLRVMGVPWCLENQNDPIPIQMPLVEFYPQSACGDGPNTKRIYQNKTQPWDNNKVTKLQPQLSNCVIEA